MMTTHHTALAPVPALATGSRLAQLALAAFLGLFVVGFAGFAPISAVHNAAHDVRHSLAFPCH
jgi:cobalt transporter subunit CbtB